MGSLKQQSAKAVAWDFAGKIAGQTVGLVISIFLARLLSPEDFGLLAMANVIIALSSSLIDMGLGVALIQRKEVSDAHYGSVFFFNITLGLFLTLTLFFCAPLVAKFYDREMLLPIVRAMSVLFLLSSIGNVIRTKLRKELEYGIPTKGRIISAVLSGAVGITMAFCGFGVWSLVIQSLLNPVINNIYLFYMVKWRPKLIFRWQALKELWGFGFRMFLSGLLDTVYGQIDYLIIGKLFDSSSLGQYYRAKSFSSYVTHYFSDSLMSVLFPVLSQVANEKERYKSIIYKSFHLLNLGTWFLLGFLYLTASDILVLLFTSKWLPAVGYFQIFILGSFMYPFSALLVNIISSHGNSKAFFKLSVLRKVFLTINLLVGFWFGIEGYLYGMVIAYIFAVVLNIYFAAKEMNVKQRWFYNIIYKYLIMVVGLTVSLYFAGSIVTVTSKVLHLLLFGGTYTILYFFISYVFKLEGLSIVKKEILPTIINKWRKK